ncbi:MAG: hypothetical protein IKB61_04375 [Elusimicrobiaceae bacterium]|nr:hypothetical protein [Elusimicrobiaceae bacterium]
MNSRLLKSKMTLHGDTQADLAEALGTTRSNMNGKINAYKYIFQPREIAIIKERYNLTDEEVQAIFFN